MGLSPYDEFIFQKLKPAAYRFEQQKIKLTDE